MKRSDIVPDTQTGKFLNRAKPLGTVTPEMVTRRAKEIAVVNGRAGNNFTEEDLEQARRELVGFDAEEPMENTPATSAGPWTGEAASTGSKTPVRGAPDEQQFGEKLVREGVDEAGHHQMLAGSNESRRKDTVDTGD